MSALQTRASRINRNGEEFMQTNVKQVFYFHASATALGGFLEEPYRVVPTPCSVALSSTGGAISSQAKDYAFNDGIEAGNVGIKATAAYTYVTGRPTQQNGPWTERTVSVVHGFNLLGRITADSLIAQIFVEHPAYGGGLRRISFAGSQFENLRLDGEPLALTMNATLLPRSEGKVDAYNQDETIKPALDWPTLTGYARKQGAERMAQKSLPGWGRDRFGWIAAPAKDANSSTEGYTLCSLVDKIDGVATGQTFAHCLDLPDFGRIFLAEVTILPFAAHLTMFRAELGCKISGQFSAAVVTTNGTTMPPD
jgi:hypothetical protein